MNKNLYCLILILIFLSCNTYAKKFNCDDTLDYTPEEVMEFYQKRNRNLLTSIDEKNILQEVAMVKNMRNMDPGNDHMFLKN